MAKDTRERMIETTARLLQHRGYHGTPLSRILSESSAPRGSLYFHFPGGKDELVVAATRASIAEATHELKKILEVAENPATAARLFFDSTADILEETRFTFGCPVAQAVSDASGDIRELEIMCHEAFEEWVGLFRDAFVASGIAPERAKALALLVEAAVEGLLLIARAYKDTEALRIVAVELETIIAAAMPGKGKRAKRRSA